MPLSPKSKVNLVIGTVCVAAVLILVLQNLTAVKIDIFYFTIDTSLSVLIPTIFVLGGLVGWAANSFFRRRREKRAVQNDPQ